jgi:hypothetical protein
MASHKCPGEDGISSNILKGCVDALTLPITLIIQRSFSSGTVPSEWKKAVVCPLHKKGDRLDPKNYRPISLTSSVAKLAERCLLDSLLPVLEQSEILPNFQFGFRQGMSCEYQLLHCLRSIWSQVQSKQGTNLVFFDFQKAFDSVVHRKLIYKLSKLGVGGTLIKWVENFITSRFQRVKVDECYSSWSEVRSGVPQGSVSGPIFFLIYISDILDKVPDQVGKALFADDLKLFHFDRVVLQTSINLVYEWSCSWQLPLNLDKLQLLRVGKIQKNPEPFFVNGVKISETSSTRDLGVIMDSDLSFTDHIKMISCEAHRKSNFILRRFNHLSKKNLTYLFLSTVRSHLEYCSTVWNPTSKLLCKTIESVQRRFTKRLRGLSKVDYPERLKLLKLTTLEQRRCYLDQIMTFKIITGSSCLPFDMFFRPATQRSLQLRGHSRRLELPLRCHGRERGLFWVRCLKQWNSLPREAGDCKSLDLFKKLCV